MALAARIGLAALAAFVTAIPTSGLFGGLIWAFLEGTLHYGCFRGTGGEAGYGWICGDGMSKVLPSIFIAGAIFVALFCCYLALFTEGRETELTDPVYSIVSVVAAIPALLWILAELPAATAYLDPGLAGKADFISGAYGICLVVMLIAVVLQLACLRIRTRRTRLVVLGIAFGFSAISVLVAPVTVAVVAPWAVSMGVLALTSGWHSDADAAY